MAAAFQSVRLPGEERRGSQRRVTVGESPPGTLERGYLELSEAYERLAAEFRKSIDLSLSLCKQLEASEQEKAALRRELSAARPQAFTATNFRSSRVQLADGREPPRASRKGPAVLPSHSASERELRLNSAEWRLDAAGASGARSIECCAPQGGFELQREALRAQLAELAEQIDEIRLHNSSKVL